MMIEASKVDTESHSNNETGLIGEQIEADRLIKFLQQYIDDNP